MALDRTQIGRVLPAYSVEVEKGRLRFFAKAIGETNPIYADEQAAQKAGYRSMPIPPTFLFTLEREDSHRFEYLHALGADLHRVLHGEQSFTYHQVVCAGDVVTFEPRIADIYDKKGGALEFIVLETNVKAADGSAIAELRSVIVLRNG
jgi:acyl dehydratase